jgi:hypothetical protein
MPAPAPQPQPGDVVRLTPDLLYVIDADCDLLILSSPAGVVSVTDEEGPVKVRGRFVDAPGKVETRTFKGKSVHTVEVLKTGRVELLIIPVGAKAPVLPNDIIRRTLDVDAGEGPQPPPTPKPVEPKVEPAKSLRVFLIFESGDTVTPAQRGVLYGKAVEDWLNANCTGGRDGWRRRDKDAPGEADPTMAAMWAAVQPKVTVTPCVAVERDGKVDLIALEATPAKMVEVLNTYKAGK